MTKNESFKQRIRSRMAKTGERYTAARQMVLAQGPERSRTWVAEPDVGDDAVRATTGLTWEQWCDRLDRWDGDHHDHTALAAFVRDDLKTDPWWSQTVAIGYERITGIRLPYQRADGTFTATKSATIVVAGEILRDMLLSDVGRGELFPSRSTTLVSKATAKTMRVEIGPGIAEFRIEVKDPALARVAVDHGKLPTFDDVGWWRQYWGDWLEALDGALVDGAPDL